MRNNGVCLYGTLLALLSLAGCGDSDVPETPDKSVRQVEEYVESEDLTLEQAADKAVEIQKEETENSVPIAPTKTSSEGNPQ